MKNTNSNIIVYPLVSIGQLTIETKYNPPEGFERIYNDGYSKFFKTVSVKEKEYS